MIITLTMYSGFIAFYGVRLTCEEFFKLFEKLGVVFPPEVREEKTLYMHDLEDIQDLLVDYGYKFDLDSLLCCYNDGKVFMGCKLGGVEVVYRDEVTVWEAIYELKNDVLDQLNNIEKRYNKKKYFVDRRIKKLAKALKQIMTKDEFDTTYGKLLDEVKIYKYANDCESCT